MAGNRWVRLDCDYLDNSKVLAAGRDGRDLHLASILWVGRHEKDGVIPAHVVKELVRSAGVRASTVDLLTSSGLWVANGGSTFELHGYLERNPSKAENDREREGWRVRQQRRRGSGGRYVNGHADVTP